MTKFLDIFTPIKKGNFGLTDEAIYKSIQHEGQFIPVFGGTQEHNAADRFIPEHGRTKYDEPITIFNGDGIIISLDGSSGCMTYVISRRFALNHHAGFFQLKEEAKQLVIPEFFSLFLKEQLQEASVSEGSKTLTLTMLESMDFDIPSYPTQQRVMKVISPTILLKKGIENLISKIELTLEKNLILKLDNYESVLLSGILKHVSRNDSLSEEGIYKRSSEVNESTRIIKVISGSINGFYGCYPLDKTIHMVNDKCCLQVVTRGKACLIRYLGKGTYATNTNSMLLVLKDEAKAILELTSESDEETYLKFLEFYLYPFFKEFSSSADLSVFPLTEAIDKISIPLIKLNDEIKSVSEQYQILKDYLFKLNSLLSKIEDIFKKTLFTETTFGAAH